MSQDRPGVVICHTNKDSIQSVKGQEIKLQKEKNFIDAANCNYKTKYLIIKTSCRQCSIINTRCLEVMKKRKKESKPFPILKKIQGNVRPSWSQGKL